jgi:hypothetical protein
MELEDLLTEAARLLGRFSAEVKAAGAASKESVAVDRRNCPSMFDFHGNSPRY